MRGQVGSAPWGAHARVISMMFVRNEYTTAMSADGRERVPKREAVSRPSPTGFNNATVCFLALLWPTALGHKRALSTGGFEVGHFHILNPTTGD